MTSAGAFRTIATVVLVALLAPAAVLAQQHESRTADLAQVLGNIAVTTRTPLFAELAMPLPHGFAMSYANRTAEQLLNATIKASPEYEWKWEGRVAHVYHRRLLRRTANFLNVRLKWFVVPGNVADLKMILQDALRRCTDSKLSGQLCVLPAGGVLDGLYAMELAPLRLTMRPVAASSAREICLKAADESRQFYSIVVFPRANVRSRKDVDFAFDHWAWHSLSDPAEPFEIPFSWYEREFEVAADVLLERLLTPITRSHKRPTSTLRVAVNEHGSVYGVRVIDGKPIRSATLEAVRSWRFKPYLLDGLPARVNTELAVTIDDTGSLQPCVSRK